MVETNGDDAVEATCEFIVIPVNDRRHLLQCLEYFIKALSKSLNIKDKGLNQSEQVKVAETDVAGVAGSARACTGEYIRSTKSTID